MAGLMIQGTGSNVGKSLIVAGICRALRLRGLSVAPFKPQNMSNNAAVTQDGGEIGRAQALQARAAGLAPHSDMNPVLLKPESEMGSQVIVQGKRLGRFPAREYWGMKGQLMTAVLESYHRLAAAHDLVVVEGAGSASEINLRATDIANMGFAQASGVPVFLLGDIDRGGVIAQIVGTKAVIDPVDSEIIKGFIINKFRGDPRLFDAGYRAISDLSGWPGMGVIPAFPEAHLLPAEDAQDLGRSGPVTMASGPRLRIGWLVLPRIANYDDLDPLAAEEGVELIAIRAGQAIPGDLDLAILPGSKSTRGDLDALRAEGWDIDLIAHHRRGGRVLGICGGYQMLGRQIHDPEGIEGAAGSSAGLGLLDIETVLQGDKALREVAGLHLGTDQPLRGYEIHLGQSCGPDRARPFARIAGQDEGAVSGSGRVSGTYLHGLFAEDGFRAAYLAALGGRSDLAYDARIEEVLDHLAAHLEQHLDLDRMLRIAGL